MCIKIEEVFCWIANIIKNAASERMSPYCELFCSINSAWIYSRWWTQWRFYYSARWRCKAKICNKYEKHVFMGRYVLAVLAVRKFSAIIQLVRVGFSYLHGQNKYKSRIFVYCSVCTKKSSMFFILGTDLWCIVSWYF